MRSFALCAVLAPSFVAGLFWDAPVETSVAESGPDPWAMSPVPTNAPVFNLELLKRQEVDADRTCGYVNGDVEEALTCNNGYICAVNTKNNAAGCCKSGSITNGCTLTTRCVEFASLSSVGSSVLADTMVTKCTNSQSPYCYTAVFPIGSYKLSYLGCSASRGVETALQSFTNTGISSRRTITSARSSSATGTTTSSAASSTSSTSSSQTSTTTNSAANSSNTPEPSSSGSKSNTGAIVGGVIGAIAILALIGFGILFFCMKNKKNKNAAATAPPPLAAASNQPPPPQMTEQQYQAPYGQAPPPAGYYPPQQAEPLPVKQHFYHPSPQLPLGQHPPSIYGPPPALTPGPNSPVAPPYEAKMAPPPDVAEAPAAVPAQQGPPPGVAEMGAPASVRSSVRASAPPAPQPQGKNMHEMA